MSNAKCPTLSLRIAPILTNRIGLITLIKMTNGKKIESYLYQVTDSGPAETPLGKMNAVHLVKQRDAGDNNQIEVWLATERHFVPIKILVVESDGARYEWIITRLEFKPT